MALAAGTGTRLRPLTLHRPKALCPVGGVPLVDLALDRLRSVTDDVAVNVHHHASQLLIHLDGRAHVSWEQPVALGTAGALAKLRPWIDGRGVLVVNADTWCPGTLAPLVDGWDGERTRLLVAATSEFGPGVGVAGAVVPWSEVLRFQERPSGLVESSWAAAHEAGRLDVLPYDGPFVDCGNAADYLRANLWATGGASSISPGAVVEGDVVESVVWDGAVVLPRERLVRAIRTGTCTVLVRTPVSWG